MGPSQPAPPSNPRTRSLGSGSRRGRCGQSHPRAHPPAPPPNECHTPPSGHEQRGSLAPPRTLARAAIYVPLVASLPLFPIHSRRFPSSTGRHHPALYFPHARPERLLEHHGRHRAIRASPGHRLPLPKPLQKPPAATSPWPKPHQPGCSRSRPPAGHRLAVPASSASPYISITQPQPRLSSRVIPCTELRRPSCPRRVVMSPPHHVELPPYLYVREDFCPKLLHRP